MLKSCFIWVNYALSCNKCLSSECFVFLDIQPAFFAVHTLLQCILCSVNLFVLYFFLLPHSKKVLVH